MDWIALHSLAVLAGLRTPPYILLKADRPHPCNYPHTPTDYRHTDEHLKTGNDSYWLIPRTCPQAVTRRFSLSTINQVPHTTLIAINYLGPFSDEDHTKIIDFLWRNLMKNMIPFQQEYTCTVGMSKTHTLLDITIVLCCNRQHTHPNKQTGNGLLP